MNRRKRFLILLSLSGSTLFTGSCIEQFNGEVQSAFLAATNSVVQGFALDLLTALTGMIVPGGNM